MTGPYAFSAPGTGSADEKFQSARAVLRMRRSVRTEIFSYIRVGTHKLIRDRTFSRHPGASEGWRALSWNSGFPLWESERKFYPSGSASDIWR